MLIEDIQKQINYFTTKIDEWAWTVNKATELAQNCRELISRVTSTGTAFESTVNDNCAKISGLAELGISPTLIEEFCGALRGREFIEAANAFTVISNVANKKANDKEEEAARAKIEQSRCRDLLRAAQSDLYRTMAEESGAGGAL